MGFYEILLLAMALYCIVLEVYIIINYDFVRSRADLAVKAGEGDTPHEKLASLKEYYSDKSNLALVVSQYIYMAWSTLIIFSRYWYVGLSLILIGIINDKYFKRGKLFTICDSIVCIMIITYYVVSQIGVL